MNLGRAGPAEGRLGCGVSPLASRSSDSAALPLGHYIRYAIVFWLFIAHSDFVAASRNTVLCRLRPRLHWRRRDRASLEQGRHHAEVGGTMLSPNPLTPQTLPRRRWSGSQRALSTNLGLAITMTTQLRMTKTSVCYASY